MADSYLEYLYIDLRTADIDYDLGPNGAGRANYVVKEDGGSGLTNGYVRDDLADAIIGEHIDEQSHNIVRGKKFYAWSDVRARISGRTIKDMEPNKASVIVFLDAQETND